MCTQMERRVVVVLGALSTRLLEELEQHVRTFRCQVVDFFPHAETFRHHEAVRQCIVGVELFSCLGEDVTGDEGAHDAEDDDLAGIYG